MRKDDVYSHNNNKTNTIESYKANHVSTFKLLTGLMQKDRPS